MSDLLQISVWKNVEILVVGSTCAAVSAALEASAAGKTVAVLADEAYFGSDLAGSFQLWPHGEDELLSGAFASCEENPARPAALKRHLEHQLLQAGIPFLFGVRPVGILRDQAEAICGAVFAARTSLLAVRAGTIIDASEFGSLTRCLAPNLVARTSSIKWRVLASAEPTGWPGSIRSLEPAYRQVLSDGAKNYAAFELEISRERLGADPRSLEHVARSLLLDEKVWVAAEHLIDCGGQAWNRPGPLQDLETLDEQGLQATEGLWLANRLLSVRDANQLTDPFQMTVHGRRVGQLAALSSDRASLQPARLETGGVDVKNLSFSTCFLRSSQESLSIPSPAFRCWEPCDVLVAGGGTGGAPAAIAAARQGATTLCLESAHGLGGVGTLGLISSYWFGNKCGFTAELNAHLETCDALSRAKKANCWHPGVKSAMYHRLLQEAGGTAWLASSVSGVLRGGRRPEGVLVTTPHGCGFVHAKTFVDATGNADLAAAAGAKCRVMNRHHAAVQGTGISPRVYPSVPHQNSDHTFVEENDPEGITLAHVQVREKYPKDFETMPFVNSRERRQIVGEYEVSPLDILAERTFPDTIFTAKSNFDTHGFIVHPVFMVTPPDHKPLHAHVPLRCMIPQDLEGVLVTGLGMSAHRDALPVIRMQADVQNQGYAAGCLAAKCAASGEDFRAVDVKAFQHELVQIGILDPATASARDSFPMSPESIREAAHGDLATAKEVAILFANPELSKPLLAARVRDEVQIEKRRTAALILGLMGDPACGPTLMEWVSTADWDEGWNYRGMGQFGRSMSSLDAAILALGRAQVHGAGPLLAKLADALGPDAAFSHCRCLALAAGMLKDPALTKTLLRLLDLPDFCGHAFQSPENILADNDPDPTFTASRNLALRELYVARGLFLAGTQDPRPREILENYAGDLRGHFARHAADLLAHGADPGDDLLELA